MVVIGCLLLAGCNRPQATANGSVVREEAQRDKRKMSTAVRRLLPPTLPDPEITLFEPFDAQQKLTIELAPGVTMEFVRIPPGICRMGDGRLGNRTTVTKAYYIGRYEVTQQQWQAVMGSNPSRLSIGPMHPVERIDWDDAQQFLRRVNARCAASGMKFLLPTEAQWEFAARAGSNTQYLNNADPDFVHSYAWIGGNSDNHTHPVGERKPNAWGLYDMQGNVAEWCDGEVAGMYAVRGGCWRDGAASCLPSARVERRALVPLRLDGLRLACAPK